MSNMPETKSRGRPPLGDHSQVTLKVPNADLNALRRLTDEAVPLSVGIRRAVREYVERRSNHEHNETALG
jgi:hypothetical protein